MMQDYYITKLKECLEERKKKNALYSLRAFAMHINVPASTLCRVLGGKRKLPVKYVFTVTEKLQLSTGEKQLFIDSHDENISLAD